VGIPSFKLYCCTQPGIGIALFLRRSQYRKHMGVRIECECLFVRVGRKVRFCWEMQAVAEALSCNQL
jgi:hypothetical protein